MQAVNIEYKIYKNMYTPSTYPLVLVCRLPKQSLETAFSLLLWVKNDSTRPIQGERACIRGSEYIFSLNPMLKAIE